MVSITTIASFMCKLRTAASVIVILHSFSFLFTTTSHQPSSSFLSFCKWLHNLADFMLIGSIGLILCGIDYYHTRQTKWSNQLRDAQLNICADNSMSTGLRGFISSTIFSFCQRQLPILIKVNVRSIVYVIVGLVIMGNYSFRSNTESTSVSLYLQGSGDSDSVISLPWSIFSISCGLYILIVGFVSIFVESKVDAIVRIHSDVESPDALSNDLSESLLSSSSSSTSRNRIMSSPATVMTRNNQQMTNPILSDHYQSLNEQKSVNSDQLSTSRVSTNSGISRSSLNLSSVVLDD